VAVDLEWELAELTGAAPLFCRSCNHAYPEHEDAGGHCRGRVGGFSSPAAAIPCPCAGFRWVDPSGPSVGSYADPPQR
jgi:hypothetical protein